MMVSMKNTVHPARLGALAGRLARFVPIHLCYSRMDEDQRDDIRFSPVPFWTDEMKLAYYNAWLTAYERGLFQEGKNPSHCTAPAARRHFI